MTIDEKIKLFGGMVQSVYGVSLYEFDHDLNIINSTADESQVAFIKEYFCQSNGFQRMKKRVLKADDPFMLGTEIFGIIMGIVVYHTNKTWRMFMLGPALSAETDTVDVDYALLQDAKEGKKVDVVSLTFRNRMVKIMKEFPVLQANTFANVVCMLVYCVNGQKLRSEDLIKDTGEVIKTKPVSHKNRQRVYQTEKALLSMVRNGDLNYRSIINQATGLSSGVRINANEPLRQAKISIETLITLCVRAAIEGSLSPELAYSCGDSYVQEVERASDIGTLMNISSRMYADFVQRVHQQRINPDISNEVQNVMNYIEIHTGEEIKIASLAKMSGYTEYYLSRKFKSETHYSINDYIAVTRIERAKVLLSTTEFSISTIAEDLSFCTNSYFTSVFRKYAGMTPAEYRLKSK